MAYLVVAYPKLSEEDFKFIQDYRKVNDPKFYSLIDPHITLVFSIHDLSEEDFIAEVEKQPTNINKFVFEIKVATINQDDSGEYFHEFLVPDKGYSDIVKLHDKLYSGLFSKYLRFDIDFIPHIGIGNSENALTSKSRIDELNEKGLNIKGSVVDIDIIEYKDGKIKTLKKISLN